VRYLVDTDWVIHYLNGRADIVTRIQELSPLGIAMSVISLAELYEGVYCCSTRARPHGYENLHGTLTHCAIRHRGRSDFSSSASNGGGVNTRSRSADPRVRREI
jgi:hypothetical protein